MRIGWNVVAKYKTPAPWVLSRKDWKGETVYVRRASGEIARWKTREGAARHALELNIKEATS